MKIAVIGSGISGLSAAHFLSKKHKVDLFEKDNHFGGHSLTLDVKESNAKDLVSLDLGFIVFNKVNYPQLVKFFKDLNIICEKSNMSFAISVKNSKIEYTGTGLKGIFVNKSNLFDLNFLKMIKEIIFFYKEATKLDEAKYQNKTLEEFLQSKSISNYFTNYHILPMVAAIWSIPTDLAKKMPMSLFLKFFKNHGLFKLNNRPQWYTVTGRSRKYVNKVLTTVSGEYFKNYEIKSVFRNHKTVRLYYGSSNEYFNYDQVVFASHADDTLKLLQDPSIKEKEILGSFKYKKNIAYLHFDDFLMPDNKKAWSSWNSLLDKNDINKSCITYWLNKLQNLNTTKNYFLTLNPIFDIKPKKILKKLEFFHPIYDLNSLNAQKNLEELQGINNSWFCGSYFGYGFHEDGLKSGLNVATKL